MINYLYLDGETTGLNPSKHDIVQLACIPVINSVVEPNAFNQYCQPKNWKDIDPGALKVNNLTLAQLKTFQSPEDMVENLVNFLTPYGVKFTIAGYNVDFDKNFIAELFKKVGRENDFLNLFNADTRDSYKRAKLLKSKLPTANLKLATLCAHFEIPINAHDALSDIQATIVLDKILSDMLGDVEVATEKNEYIVKDTSFKEPVQLHCHSMYSYTDSLNSVGDWVEWSASTNTPGFSIVDHGNAASLYEVVRIKDILKKKKIDKNIAVIPGTGLRVEIGGNVSYLNAWAVSTVGYRNIIKLASIGWANKVLVSDVEFPVIPIEEVVPYSEGVIFGVPGVNGPVAQLLASNKNFEAENIINFLKSKLDIRLELAALDVFKYFDENLGFRSYSVSGGNIQKVINNFYYDISKKLNVKCVPVSDAHFIHKEDKVVQDCISRNSYKDGRCYFESRHALNVNEMYAIIKGHISSLSDQEFAGMIDNTYEIMNLASNIEVKHDYHLPLINIPDEIKAKTDDYKSQTYYYTMQLIKEHGRWNNSPEYVTRFKKEIDVVMNNATLNFLPYFLVYEDICRFVRANGFLQNLARGSAGGSLLSYYLKIIHIDPVAADLPFERFLSHARIRAGSFPDIDLDIADNARSHVMSYLKEKYGLGFAQIATFNKMKTKNAIKDSMWALYGRNRNDPEVSAVCETIPDSPQGVDEFDFLYGYTDQEGEDHAGQIDTNDILKNFFNNKPEVEKMVKKLIGSIRGWSRHASAFVISTIDLASDRVPTMVMDDKELGTILVTQYDGAQIEKSGLVKADILGLKTLAMTSDCIKLISDNHAIDFLEEERGVPLLYRLPDKDPGVFADFYNKKTDSSFQFNTELIKGYAQQFAPLCRADLATMTALCRPGALDAPLYDTTAAQYYMDIRNGARTIEYLHPDLEPILKNSNGIFCYQEEIMKFLVEIVGYSWEESDLIRSAIAKKKHEVIMNCFTRIRESCEARGWSKEAIETICQQIQAFSRYSFNKSHSYAYGELGYITLYLKHHYPLEWWTAVLNNEDKAEKIRKNISYLGDTVAPPSLKNPSEKFTILGDKIVAPISVIKGIGPAVVHEAVSKGPFKDLEDFVSRVEHNKINIGSISALIKARAADDLMDQSIEDYAERRKKFMDDYCSLRKNKTSFKPDMYEINPIKLFLEEKELNQVFNKTLLSDPAISEKLAATWPGLKQTTSKAIPFMMGTTPVLSGIKVAEGLLHKGHSTEVGMILLFDSSEYRQGVSQKGRKWSRVSVATTDGFNMIECVDWNGKAALGWNKNTIIYVTGTLREGWKTPVSLTVTDKIEKVQ